MPCSPERQPKPGHLAAIPYQDVPALFATLVEISQPAHDYFTCSEAKRAIGNAHGTHYQFIKDLRTGKIPAIKAPPSLPAQIASGIVREEWRIMPADLYDYRPMVIDVIPGVKPVIYDLIMMCALTGPRPSEMRMLRWEQITPDRLIVISWQETKEGDHIEHDLVIPLSAPANAIIDKMLDIRRRYRMQTPYVFANYPSRFNTNAIIGQPPCNVTALEQLDRSLKHAFSDNQLKATMHGFRTNIRSWGEDQRRPDGSRRFDEKDLERALHHIAGFGKTKVARTYSRQSSDVIPLIPIYQGWGQFVTTGHVVFDNETGQVIFDTDNVVPFRRQSSTGG
jgi:integrase